MGYGRRRRGERHACHLQRGGYGMSTFEALEAYAARHLRRLIGPLHRRRHHRRTLRRGMVDEEARRRARTARWADDPRWYPRGTPPRPHNRVTPLVDGEKFIVALDQ